MPIIKAKGIKWEIKTDKQEIQQLINQLRIGSNIAHRSF